MWSESSTVIYPHWRIKSIQLFSLLLCATFSALNTVQLRRPVQLQKQLSNFKIEVQVMPRARPAKRSNKRQKHAYASDLEDPVFEAKMPTTLQPIDWEEDEKGDLLPVFGIEYAYTERQLERYDHIPAYTERSCASNDM
jgi:hypothetical protein